MLRLLKKLIPLTDLKGTVLRFPLPTGCSLVLFILLVLGIHDVIDIDEIGNSYARVMLLAAYSFFWFVLVRVIAEARVLTGAAPKSGALFEYGLGLTGFSLLAIAIFSEFTFSLSWMLILMIPALLLALGIGPYFQNFFRAGDNLSFWFYNRRLWFGTAVAIASGVIWGAGLSAALGSIDYLFEINIESEVYADIWSFSLVLFAPLYALNWVPGRYRYSEEDCHAPLQLAFVLNWVLSPLVLVYLLILYAYFIKIALAQILPRGQLSYMVTAFASLGILTYLAGWPLREQGGAMLRLLQRWFFPALLIPTGMQTLAIYQRVDQYGITEPRYIVALSAIWFGALAVAYTISKPPLKWIPGLLAALLVFAALGPVSAPKVAERSQFARLETLLIDNQILVNGKISESARDISFDDRKSISSILTFLQKRKKLDRIKLWLDNSDWKAGNNPYAITKLMGFEYISHYETEQRRDSEIINLQGQEPDKLRDISGFDYLTTQHHIYCPSDGCSDQVRGHSWHDGDTALHSHYESGQLSISVETTDKAGLRQAVEVVFDIQDFVESELDKSPNQQARELSMEKSQEGFRVKVIFSRISAKMSGSDDSKYTVQNFNYTVLVGEEVRGGSI